MFLIPLNENLRFRICYPFQFEIYITFGTNMWPCRGNLRIVVLSIQKYTKLPRPTCYHASECCQMGSHLGVLPNGVSDTNHLSWLASDGCHSYLNAIGSFVIICTSVAWTFTLMHLHKRNRMGSQASVLARRLVCMADPCVREIIVLPLKEGCPRAETTCRL